MATETDEELDAYALLSKPTLELSDGEVEKIVVDLRERRKLYLASGKPDVPRKAKAKAAPKAKSSAEEKARNTALLLGQLKMSLEKEDKK